VSDYVYILASGKNGTLYVGLTNDLARRIYEHKTGVFSGFTKRYKIHLLVYSEEFLDRQSAMSREKQIKGWKREWKIRLMIEEHNSEWIDFYDSI
jgi:putative endonuclease